MEERLEEISGVMTLIEKLCQEYNISLVAKEHKGTKYVGIHDNLNNKDYCLVK